jgi:hypothetical protein
MSFTVINLSSNPANLPAVNLASEEKTDKVERIVFVKPHEDGFCFVSTYEENGICIDHAEITCDSQDGTNRVIDYCRQNEIEHVRYDFSLFIQEGKAIREALPETEVYLYRPKQTLVDRIIAHLGFIRSNFVFDEEPASPEAYQKFVSVREQFNSVLTYEHRNEARLPKEAYNIAMDILTDVAKYYRRNRG